MSTFALRLQLAVAHYRMGLVACVYLVAAVLMPLYNKALFSGFAGLHVAPFAHPLTATAVQLWAVVLLLLVCGALYDVAARSGSGRRQIEQRVPWRSVLLHTLLPSVAFSGVIALSNLGVQAVSVALHVLLKCGELVAIVVAGAAIEREVPTLIGFVCCVIAALGIALLSVDAHVEFDVSTAAILLHVGAVACGGLHVALMRRAWRRLAEIACSTAPDRAALLSDEDKRAALLAVRHEAPLLRRVAVTKLALSAALVTVAAAAGEPAAWPELFDPTRTSTATGLLLAGGVLLTVMFQLSNIAMPRYATSLSVAFVEQVKVLPQLLLAILVGVARLNVGPIALLGAALVIAATIAFATERRFQLSHSR